MVGVNFDMIRTSRLLKDKLEVVNVADTVMTTTISGQHLSAIFSSLVLSTCYFVPVTSRGHVRRTFSKVFRATWFDGHQTMLVMGGK